MCMVFSAIFSLKKSVTGNFDFINGIFIRHLYLSFLSDSEEAIDVLL